MQSEEIHSDMPDYKDLLQANAALQQRLQQMEAREQYLWITLMETSRKLQSSSASIKAAVSSLLNYDIFWDSSNQHEFLETINTSIDQVSELVKLVALESRLSSKTLEFKPEPHFIQEILTMVRVNLLRREPNLVFKTGFPEDGKLVEVDYSYLTIALEQIVIVAAAYNKPGKVELEAIQEPSQWRLNVMDIHPTVLSALKEICGSNRVPSAMKTISAENALKLHVACEIFKLHEIQIEISGEASGVSLLIPVTGQ